MSLFRSFTFWIVLFLAFSIYSFNLVENGKNVDLRQEVKELTVKVEELETSRHSLAVYYAEEWNALHDHLALTLPKEQKVLTKAFDEFEWKGEKDGKELPAVGEAPKK